MSHPCLVLDHHGQGQKSFQRINENKIFKELTKIRFTKSYQYIEVFKMHINLTASPTQLNDGGT